MFKSKILIDADTYLFKAALPATKEIDWEEGEGLETYIDMAKAKTDFTNIIKHILRCISGDENYDNYGLAFTLGRNFRYDIYPEYKHGRPPTPQAVKDLKAWALETYADKILKNPSDTFILEADDIVGYYQDDTSVLVSEDKDLRQIAGVHWNLGNPSSHYISKADADLWHLKQTLMGDSTDGYPGCVGIGPDKADKLLDACSTPMLWRTVQHAFIMAEMRNYEKGMYLPHIKEVAKSKALLMARLAKMYDRTMNPNKPWPEPVVDVSQMEAMFMSKMELMTFESMVKGVKGSA